MTQPRAVVSGGGRGIGAAIVDRLRTDGYEVIPIDLLPGEGIVACDITDPAAVQQVASDIGPVDVLVNNAGAWRFGALEDVSAEDFSRRNTRTLRLVPMARQRRPCSRSLSR